MADQDLIPFEQFYKKFHPSLMAFAMYYLKIQADAQEVVNDVFLNVWDKRDDLILDDSLKSYLFQATKNRAINHLKKNKKTFMEIAEDENIEVPPDVLLKMEEKDNVERLQMLLNLLPPKCKQVFSMSRFDQLSYKEIAELMDISVKTVEHQMSKALKIFRKNLNLE
ncbi:RNA polymerase sigma-70 factor [bacterium]|nr:RNA polymerase sigma-70 factor [bacterium]